MNALTKYLEEYVEPALELVKSYMDSNYINEEAGENIIGALLDFGDEFDDESNEELLRLCDKFIDC